MVATGSFDGMHFLLINPLFQRGIADTQNVRGVAWQKERRFFHENVVNYNCSYLILSYEADDLDPILGQTQTLVIFRRPVEYEG